MLHCSESVRSSQELQKHIMLIFTNFTRVKRKLLLANRYKSQRLPQVLNNFFCCVFMKCHLSCSECILCFQGKKTMYMYTFIVVINSYKCNRITGENILILCATVTQCLLSVTKSSTKYTHFCHKMISA